MRFEIPGAQ